MNIRELLGWGSPENNKPEIEDFPPTIFISGCEVSRLPGLTRIAFYEKRNNKRKFYGAYILDNDFAQKLFSDILIGIESNPNKEHS